MPLSERHQSICGTVHQSLAFPRSVAKRLRPKRTVRDVLVYIVESGLNNSDVESGFAFCFFHGRGDSDKVCQVHFDFVNGVLHFVRSTRKKLIREEHPDVLSCRHMGVLCG